MEKDALPLPETGVQPFPNFLPQPSSVEEFISFSFFIIFVVWAVYSLISIYHWLRFGHNSWIAIPAIVVHLFISGFLFLFATSGLH